MFIGVRKRQTKTKGVTYNIYKCDKVDGKRKDKYIFKITDEQIKSGDVFDVIPNELGKIFTGADLEDNVSKLLDKLQVEAKRAVYKDQEDRPKEKIKEAVNGDRKNSKYLFDVEKLDIRKTPCKQTNIKYERVNYNEFLFAFSYDNNKVLVVISNEKELREFVDKIESKFIYHCAKVDGIDVNKRVYRTYRKQMKEYLLKECEMMEAAFRNTTLLQSFIIRALEAEYNAEYYKKLYHEAFFNKNKYSSSSSYSYTKNVSPSLSKKEYYALLKFCHPDANGNSEESNRATQILNKLYKG